MLFVSGMWRGLRRRSELTLTVQVLDRAQQPSPEAGPGAGEGDDSLWIFVVYRPEVRPYRDSRELELGG